MTEKLKVAWCITGAGEKLTETYAIMKDIKNLYGDRVEINVFISKAGDQVVKYYGLYRDLETSFDRKWVEINANSPFLAGQVQLGKYDFVLVAPCTSNSTAKISLRIADTLITNAVIMAQKASVPVYIMPSDYSEGVVVTTLPNGKKLELKMTREDVEHVKRISRMDDTEVFSDPRHIYKIFENWTYPKEEK
ncbi:archaeoflavoprotein AfpA [Methanothermobacter wolfeii]|uniref:archaeoflavoprotein AfpA n=1 Tax=Methanothermobacter wolfeii TaxID=145261 RepID=UPI0024B3A21D|nr:archaeoflavoprotein AfpA [Methanothermobacter wolfeii]MDI6701365.1 archaeoflavoprotein AfpA [Methanothermobacter wolfeii]